jgi:GT2 family glycosyltransferase
MSVTSIIIVTYQSEAFIGRTIDATLALSPDAEIIVVDNASTDNTRSVVSEKGVRLVSLEDNSGFVGGCHAGANAASGDTLVFLGHDVTPEPGWLGPLVAAANTPGVGAAMATIEDASNPGHYNTSGGHLTYFGIAWVSDLGEPVSTTEVGLVDVPFPSGAAMAIATDVWEKFGGFRRTLFMYHEDTDLGWRLRLAGLRIVRSPTSRVLHHYDFARSETKMYWLERNRRVLLATNYTLATRVLLAPALLAADGGIWLVAIRDGWRKEKAAAYKASLRARRTNASERRSVKALRTVGDAEMLRHMEWSIAGMQLVDPPRGSSVADAFLGWYLRMIIPAVAFFDRLGGRTD